MAGASSSFYGEKVLTTGNPDTAHDQNLFERLKTVAVLLKIVEFAAAARALSAVMV
jgi:biotin synthase